MNSKIRMAALLLAVTLVGVPVAATAGVQPLGGDDRQAVKDNEAADAVEKNIKEAAAKGSREARRELADWNALSGADQLEVGKIAASEEFALAVASGETDPAALRAIGPELMVTVDTGTAPTSGSS